MSKLDGNERWKSKMLLTEHQEQYQSRHMPKVSGRPTPEELTMIRDAIILPHMLTMSDKAHADISKSGHLFRRHYASLTLLIMDRITKDLNELKRDLRARNIRIVENETQDSILYHTYYCRGYNDKFGIVRETLRAEISLRLAKYGSEILKSAGL